MRAARETRNFDAAKFCRGFFLRTMGRRERPTHGRKNLVIRVLLACKGRAIVVKENVRGGKPFLRVRTGTFSRQAKAMSKEELDATVAPAPAPEPVPTSDTQNRLTAAREFAGEQYEKIRRAAADQMENVRRYTQDARRQLNEGWDVTRTKAKDLHRAGEEYVKANPTSCVLGALGVGLILGLLLGSRR